MCEFKVAPRIVEYVAASASGAPQSVLNTFMKLSARFAELGFVLRTPYQNSADQAFIDGCIARSGQMEIWHPWHSEGLPAAPCLPTSEAHAFCSRRVPGFNKLHAQTKMIHARLANLLLGSCLDLQAKFVIVWSPDGAERELEKTKQTGDVSSIISLAETSSIPVINFGREGAMSRLAPLVEALKIQPSIEDGEVAIRSLRASLFVSQMCEIFEVKEVKVTPYPGCAALYQSMPEEDSIVALP